MAQRVTPLFIPLRRETVAALISRGAWPTGAAELAALMAIAILRRTPSLSAHQVERALFDVQTLVETDAAAAAESIAAAWTELGPVSMEDLEDLMASRHIVFAPSSGLAWEQEPIEHYDSSFQDQMKVPLLTVELDVLQMEDEDPEEERFDDEPRPAPPVVTLTGTREQTLSANTIVSMLDEHIDVDAYAGTGKTHLIMALATRAPAAFTYIAPFQAHMHGGRQAAAHEWAELRTRTLFELALATAHPLVDALGLGKLRLGEGDVPPAERAQIAGINSIGSHSPAQVIYQVQRAINSWSESDSRAIQPHHFKGLPRGPIDPMWLAAGEAVWKAMWSKHRGHPFNLRLSHLVKWLNLQDATPSTRLGTLLVDEAHDLMPSWRQFLERYPGGCVFLGDPYQRLTGRMPRHGRNKLVAMNQSFRMGMSGEQAVRRTLDAAPEHRPFDQFLGSRSHVTRVRHWGDNSDDLQDGLRVYANEWSLLEDAQRLKQEGGRYRLLPATIRELRTLVTGATTLFNQREPDWRTHAGGHRTWDELAERLVKEGRSKVVRLFERGYNLAKFDELLEAQAPENEERITLGLVGHVKNLESSTVALNECCFTEAQTRHGHVPAHAVYLAISRVRDELWLPGDAFNRLADLKAPEPQPWVLAPA